MGNNSEWSLAESLTEREQDVLALLVEGKANREIAAELVLSLNTVKWYARQIYGKLGVSDRQAAVRRALALGLLPAEQMEELPVHNLPAQLTPFVGRQQELAELEQLLVDPAVRLITIIGPGGMGKTRLALQAARRQLHRNPQTVADGITFVSLAEVNDVQDVAELLIRALNLAPVQGEGGVRERLQRYLRKRQVLLLLDDVEQLVGRELSGLLDDLLGAAPGLAVLATSRARLNVRGEHLLWIQGLQLAGIDTTTSPPDLAHLLETSSAAALFLHTAQRAHPDFVLTEENTQPVTAICRLVEGMPLGIELAAAWVGLLTLDELLQELSRSPDILSTEAGNVPAKQRSLRAVFDTSWALLEDPERRALRCLSVFRGGFAREAAQAVCDVSLPDLLALVNKCWLKRDERGRFSMHELLRQYSAEALAAHPEQFAETRVRHSAIYCRWLAAQQETILGPQQQETLTAVERELSNIRMACLAAIATGHAELLRQALHTLALFYRGRGRYRAGERMFASLLRTDGGGAGTVHDLRRLRARLLVWRAELQGLAGYDHGSDTLISEALALVEQLEQAGQEMPFERMLIIRERGYQHLLQAHNSQAALGCFIEEHEHARKVGLWWAVAESQMSLARARRNLGRLREAEEAVAEAIELYRDAQNAAALAEAITLRGSILARRGYVQEALTLLQEELRLETPHPFVEGYRLVNRAWAHLLLGQFDEAEVLAEQGIETFLENEIWSIALPWIAILGEIRLHRGRFASAESTMAEMIAMVPSGHKPEAKAIDVYLHGARALAQGKWGVAAEHLQHSLTRYKASPDWNTIGPNACLALAARGLGHHEQAGPFLEAELRLALASHAFLPLVVSLYVAALLLADHGQAERATEIYARVGQEPFAQNSIWLRDVAGRELQEISARLPEDARAAAQERGQGLDLWEVAEGWVQA